MNKFLQIMIDKIGSFDTIYKNRIKSHKKSIEEKKCIYWMSFL